MINNISVFDYIESLIPTLDKTDKLTAQGILDVGDNIINLSIDELSKKINCSKSSIVRFSKTLGYKGFKNLKVVLILSINSNGNNQSRVNGKKNAMQEIIENESISLALLESILDFNTLNQSAKLMSESKMIYLCGTGASYIVALDFAQKLQRIGIPCAVFQDPDMQIISSINAHPRDLFFCITYSGENSTINAILKNNQEHKNKCIILSSHSNNSFIKKATIYIQIPKSEIKYRMSAGVSRIHDLIVVDIIYHCLIKIIGVSTKTKLINSVHKLKNRE